MVDEHEEYHEEGQGQEEEYHFSDDQATYEVEPDAAQSPEGSTDVKQAILEKVTRYRRVIIGLAVFFILIFVAYKFLSPTPVPNEAEQTNITASAPKMMQQAPSAAKAMPAQPAQASQPQMMQQPVVSAPRNPIEERLTALEQQNARLMNLIQTQYEQKIAEHESQQATVQAKLQELNTRLSNLEANMNQFMQLMMNRQMPATFPPQPGMMPAAPPAAQVAAPKPPEPKMIYTVQAIIPGRAWLKSESGDTVTVAEGDVLKDFGRVTKINPYDGVVEIDTGSKLIALSYGGSSD